MCHALRAAPLLLRTPIAGCTADACANATSFSNALYANIIYHRQWADTKCSHCRLLVKKQVNANQPQTIDTMPGEYPTIFRTTRLYAEDLVQPVKLASRPNLAKVRPGVRAPTGGVVTGDPDSQ